MRASSLDVARHKPTNLGAQEEEEDDDEEEEEETRKRVRFLGLGRQEPDRTPDRTIEGEGMAAIKMVRMQGGETKAKG